MAKLWILSINKQSFVVMITFSGLADESKISHGLNSIVTFKGNQRSKFNLYIAHVSPDHVYNFSVLLYFPPVFPLLLCPSTIMLSLLL